MNIKFNYLYRDSGNYKSFNSIILGNPSSLDLKTVEEQIIEHLIEEEYFIPQKWNVPLINKFAYDSEWDHDWYEFESIEYTEEGITAEITVDAFLNNIK